MTNYILCCDWGTSFFRLQLLNPDTFECLGEQLAHEGVADTFDAWNRTGEPGSVAKEAFFRHQLRRQIDALSQRLSLDLSRVPVVLSGMASSSIGMAELPYATLPFAVDGSQASYRHFPPQPDFGHDMLLVSGVRSQHDVMRGEETQLVGLIALLRQTSHVVDTRQSVFIFPGTHSKHLYIRDGQLINFATYMTGELFNLMATESILKDSVDTHALADFSPRHADAFRLGVQQSVQSSLLSSLFTTRTNQLFDKLDKTANAFYLSGLLIGTELNHLRPAENGRLVLCSGSNLAPFYQIAIDTLALADRTTSIPPRLIDRAASVGQLLIYQNQAVSDVPAPSIRP